MMSRGFLAVVLAGAIGMCGFTAAEPPRPSPLDDLRKPNQLSEGKTEQMLASLPDRCQKVLDKQMAVYDGTKKLHKVIQDTPNKKPRPADQQASLKLAALEQDLIREVTKVIDVLKAEETLTAFTEVFREVRKDMERLQLRLKRCDVGKDTQALEQDLIETFQEMIAGFKKR
jgi:hypothetical protein